MKGKSLRQAIFMSVTSIAIGWPTLVLAKSTPMRISESKIVIRADSAATYAVQGGHVVSLTSSTNDQGRTFFTIGVQKGPHLFRVVVDPVTDQVLAVTKMH